MSRNFPVEVSGGDLWHLTGRYGINIEGAWSHYSGDGVRVGIVDDGFDLSDRDLSSNFLSGVSENLTTGSSAISGGEYSHGTRVAHLCVGDNDGSGGIGVAYDADWAAFQVQFGTGGAGRALLNAVEVDVVNNSWNNTSAFGQGYEGYVNRAVEDGRDGLGTAVVFSAGNGRGTDVTAASDGATSSLGVISVAATDQNGRHASFSSPGSSVLVSAPGVAVPYDENDYGDQSLAYGTSFSAPLVSGVVALMLEANPDLGWRDIQEILAITSRQTDRGNGSWTENGAGNWNGGGMTFSNDYGFGLVDAEAAVNLAESWTEQSTSDNMETVLVEKFWDTPRKVSSYSFNVEGDVQLDQVQVLISADTADWSNVSVKLVSPDGTVSILKLDEDTGRERLGWKFKSNAFWGESVEGEWTVRFRNVETGDLKRVDLRSLDFSGYGSDTEEDDNYFFTSEFSSIVSRDASRATISDTDGGVDTLNLAASSEDQIVNLQEGGNSFFNGTRFHLAGVNEFENVTVGNGDDRVSGNSANNSIRLGGGSDVASGRGGDDNIQGAAGNDRLFGQGGRDTLEGGNGSDYLSAGSGNDLIRGGYGGDKIAGHSGADRAFGGHGNDTIYGGGGNDIVKGGAHSDKIYGGHGSDRLFGEHGSDVLKGGRHSDALHGGGSRDRLHGEGGNDRLFGGAGNDRLNGGGGNDRLHGGAGADEFYHYGSEGHGTDLVLDYDFAEGDVFVFGGQGAAADDFVIEYGHEQLGNGNNAGDDALREAYIVHEPSGQVMWTVVDGEAQENFLLQISGQDHFLL